MSAICKKCLRCGYADDRIGEKCDSCDGIIERDPPFSELVDALPEPMTCGRRRDRWAGIPGAFVQGERAHDEGQDRWLKFKSIDNRVCSFCGSLHPDDFFRLVKEASEAPDDAEYGTFPMIEPSDKGYKIYVRQPGVRNAHEGGIKFYMQHFPRTADGELELTPEREAQYALAVRKKSAAHRRMLDKMYPRT